MHTTRQQTTYASKHELRLMAAGKPLAMLAETIPDYCPVVLRFLEISEMTA